MSKIGGKKLEMSFGLDFRSCRCSSMTDFTLLQTQRNNIKSEVSVNCLCSWEPDFSFKEIIQVHF